MGVCPFFIGFKKVWSLLRKEIQKLEVETGKKIGKKIGKKTGKMTGKKE
jgi:hypothetical protein